MTPEKYLDLKQELIKRGYSAEIDWSEDIQPCKDAASFAMECIFVICNSGMKAQIARKIYERILKAIIDHVDISEAFGNKRKVKSIKYIIKNQKHLFKGYQEAENKLDYCETIPQIGPIIKYHLVKNLGVDCIKPDRHLMRISKSYNISPFEMCKRLSDRIGDKLATVDTVIWRAANLGLV